MENIRGEEANLPQGVELINGPRLQRQVFRANDWHHGLCM